MHLELTERADKSATTGGSVVTTSVVSSQYPMPLVVKFNFPGNESNNEEIIIWQ